MPNIIIQDEGVVKGQVDDINFTGAGVTATVSGKTGIINIAGGGGSVPTGTGFRHVTAGVEDAAAKLVDTADVNNDQITYAKIQNVSAISRLLGRGSAAGVGDVEEITLGTNLAMSGTTLNASGGGGGNFFQTSIDFGTASPTPSAVVATVADAGVVSASIFTVGITPGPGRDFDEMELGPVIASVGNIVDGVSFDVMAVAIDETAHGVYTVNCSRN